MDGANSPDWKRHLKELGLVRPRRTRVSPEARPRLESVSRGRLGEDLAVRYLESRGVRVLARNVAYPDGELDAVARDGDVLAFVEVRLRRSVNRGSPSESVTAAKRRRIQAAARRWLAEHADRRVVRFDVVTLVGEGTALEIGWIKGAFDASS